MTSIISFIEQKLLAGEKNDLQKWQERSLLFVHLASAFAALPAVISSVVRSIYDQLWLNLVAYICGYSLLLLLIIGKTLSFKVKGWVSVILFFTMGTLSIFSVGPLGSGRIWFFATSVFATLILGLRAGIITLLVQIAILIFFGTLLAEDVSGWVNRLDYSLGHWVITSITFTFLSIVVIVAMGSLIKGLALALTRSRESKEQLLRTTEQLNQKVEAHNRSQVSLQESEQRWSFALEGAGDGVWDWDLQTDLVYFSVRWKSMLGYGQEFGKGIYAWLDRIHPKDRGAILDEMEKCFSMEAEGFQGRYRIRRLDGSYIWVMGRGKVMTLDELGQPYRLIGTHSDISFIKDLEEKQIAYESRLQQAQKIEAIGTLAGGIAHDFNNILTPILGNTELILRSGEADLKSQENLKEIYSATMRAKALIKQILTFSRQDIVESRPINIAVIVKEALRFIRATIPATIDIRTVIERDSDLIIGDPTQVHQIIMNLMTNAYHAMETTGGRITVSIGPVEREFGKEKDMKASKFVCLCVADTGEGIVEQVREKIFDPFFTTKQQGKGTGLGLSVVHGIVSSMGGYITVSSIPGSGTEFKIFFPVFETEFESSEPVISTTFKQGFERILLVDDEKNVVQVERNMLAFLGYDVQPFTNSAEALQQFEKNPHAFNLVITDMEMPLLSGGKLAEKIKAIRPDVPIMLCSGFSENISKERLFSGNIDVFLAKPVSMTEFSNEIRKLLEKN